MHVGAAYSSSIRVTIMSTLPLLARHVRHISLEANNDTFSFAAISEKLPVFMSDIKDFFSNTLDLANIKAFTGVGSNTVAVRLKEIPYAKLMDATVYVSPGQSEAYVVVADRLMACQHIASVLISETIDPFNKWVVKQLSDPNKMVSFTAANIPHFKLHNALATGKHLADCFKGHSNITEVKFGSVFANNQDYTEAANRLANVQLHHAKLPVSEVRNAVEGLIKNLELLVERMGSDPETYKPSGPVVKALSNAVMAIAEECSFYASYSHTLMSVIKAFNDTETALESDVKK